MKKALLLVLLALMTCMTVLIAGGFFIDLDDNPYRNAIEGLFDKTWVGGEYGEEFLPKEPLTRGQAAHWLSVALKLPRVEPLKVDQPVEKSYTYADPLGVIDESFVIASFNDLEDHYYRDEIEGLSRARILPVSESFNVDDPVTQEEFLIWLDNALYGVDEHYGNTVADRLSKLDVLGMPALPSSEPLTRELAAYMLYSVIGDPKFQVVTVLVSADIHGHLEPYKPVGSDYFIGGMAKMSQYVNQVWEDQKELLLLDVGDAPYNTNVANLFEGEPVIRIMNWMEYDAMVLGNHDFDFPFSVMERNAQLADFPFLSANTLKDGVHPNFLEPYHIVEYGGITFGIIGVTDDQSAWYTHPNNVKGITFIDHFEAAKAAVAELKGKVDFIIALAHLHGDNPVLSQKVEGIDLVYGGGTDIVAFPEKINDSWLLSSGKHAELISQTNLNFWDGELLGFTFSHIFLSQNMPDDPVVDLIVKKAVSAMDGRMMHVVGKTSVLLDGERATVRLKESNLGNVIADSLRAMTDADISFQNGGGVRASIPVGDITIKDIYTVLPFDNTVVVVEATGKQIWDAIEHGISVYPGAAGQFLQVSGVSYTFDASKEPYQRLVSVEYNGAPIEMDRKFRLVANDFLTGGGDKFLMLKECKELVRTKSYLRDAFLEYFQKNPVISPQLEGRITILNPAN
ncbi:MAG: 5'-nucleotidase C-terminal domain-containing protein [Thermotogota bacterium]|nr:5'-nucleotidase C-terminal domain-containing protein [Thermotogota bacterium]